MSDDEASILNVTLRWSGEANDTGESFDSWTMLIEVITNEEFDACYCIVKKAFKILSDFVYKTNLDSKYDSRQIKSKWQSHDVYQCILRGVWVDVKLL